MNTVGTDFASRHVRFLNGKRVMTRKGKRMILGGGAGEGLAAMCGHQSGAQGMRVEMPAFSREIEMVEEKFRFPAPPPLFLANR